MRVLALSLKHEHEIVRIFKTTFAIRAFSHFTEKLRICLARYILTAHWCYVSEIVIIMSRG